ncbi:MAG: zinc-dependent metalloprotease [Jejuia sp.]
MKIFQYTYTFIIVFAIMNLTKVDAQSQLFDYCANSGYNKIEGLAPSKKEEIKKHEQLFFNAQTSKSAQSKIQTQLIPVKFHVIRDSNGHGGLRKSSIENALAEVNAIFEEVYVNFYAFGGIDFIDDDSLNHLTKGNEEVLLDSYSEGTLNVYLADEVVNSSGSSICGYNLDSFSNKNIIILKNSCAVNGSSLTHEIGHFFSLVHTHGNGNGTAELVNGENCDTTGDGICDTPADPGLSDDNVDGNCNYTGGLKDANGDFYSPDTGNVMSYSRKSCRDHFTTGQYARMYGYYLTVKDDIFEHVEVSTTTTEGLENVKIYPNPVRDGQIFIQRDTFLNETLQFEITNLSGQILFQGFSTKDAINVSQLPSGSYFLTLSNAETKVTKRFIK